MTSPKRTAVSIKSDALHNLLLATSIDTPALGVIGIANEISANNLWSEQKADKREGMQSSGY